MLDGVGSSAVPGKRRVLVTGGAGFVGRACVRALRDAGAEVVVADRVRCPVPEGDPAVHIVLGELTDPRVLDEAMDGELDAVVHLAAATSVLGSVARPAETYETNVAVTQALLERARVTGVRRFLLASTNAVTGDVGTATISEDLPLRPLTPYGATKAACEMLLSGYAGSYGIRASALRFTNIYGPGMEHKDSFVPRLMRAAAADEGVQVYGDGSQRRDLVHVADAARAVALCWQADHAGPVIVGSGRSVSVLDLVAAARGATGRDIPVEHVPPKPGEMPAVIVDIGRARDRLGYAPALGLKAGLATVWPDFDPEGRTAAHSGGRPL